MKRIIILILMLTVVCGCIKEEKQMATMNELNYEIKHVSCNEFYKMRKDATIIDVRSKEEYEAGHIKKAFNIPLNEMSDIDKLNLNKNDNIVVFDTSNTKSILSAIELNKLGYTHVYDFDEMMKCGEEYVD